MQAIRISIYLSVLIIANMIVLHFGPTGLIITAAVLIPFDFVMRCYFHETWKGMELIIKLGTLVLVASILTYIINKESINIATASVAGFVSAQITAGIFYQVFIKRKYLIKVNGSDLIAIIFDSFIFQLIAFHSVDAWVMLSQVTLKFIGGLFWYYIIFVKLNLRK